MTKESIIGVISLGIDRVRYLSEDDASVLDYVGTTAALVIENIEFRRFMSQESRRVADMCKEVHHRVRNDLQTVAGLVFLQLQHCDSQEAKAVLTDTTMRIRSIALVHQLLSEERSELVRVGDLAEKIMETAIRASNTGQDVPAFTVTGDDVPVGPKRATHLAIVLNELITNSLTRSPYAESIRRLRCSVGRAADDQVVLEFADDGNNFAERFDASKDSALGLQIAFDIVKEDLDGCMEVIPGAGAHVRITFKN